MLFRRLLMLTSFIAYISPLSATEQNLEAVVHGAGSVEEAVGGIIDVLEDQGFEIPLVVNHSAAAASVGLSLRPTQVVFARPPDSQERRLLDRAITLGIDLPAKFLVFEDEQGEIQLRYNPIGYLIDRHDAPLADAAFLFLRGATEQFGDLADSLITIESSRTVGDTVDALTAAISANAAFRIPLIQSYEARGGVRAVLMVFGNPNAGTPLMQATQEAGIDLPQKFLVWRDRGKRVFITYNDPLFVGRRHNVQGQDARLEAIAGALANFAAAGAGP